MDGGALWVGSQDAQCFMGPLREIGRDSAISLHLRYLEPSQRVDGSKTHLSSISIRRELCALLVPILFRALHLVPCESAIKQRQSTSPSVTRPPLFPGRLTGICYADVGRDVPTLRLCSHEDGDSERLSHVHLFPIYQSVQHPSLGPEKG